MRAESGSRSERSLHGAANADQRSAHHGYARAPQGEHGSQHDAGYLQPDAGCVQQVVGGGLHAGYLQPDAGCGDARQHHPGDVLYASVATM